VHIDNSYCQCDKECVSWKVGVIHVFIRRFMHSYHAISSVLFCSIQFSSVSFIQSFMYSFINLLIYSPCFLVVVVHQKKNQR